MKNKNQKRYSPACKMPAGAGPRKDTYIWHNKKHPDDREDIYRDIRDQSNEMFDPLRCIKDGVPLKLEKKRKRSSFDFLFGRDK